MKHTPGPWKFIFTGSRYRVLDVPENLRVALISQTSMGDDGGARANARLIATAPELLETCKAFVKDPDGADPLVMAKEAIAKAEGNNV